MSRVINKVLFQKIKMTRMFNANKEMVPITVLKLEKTTCIDHKTTEQHGYYAEIFSLGEKKNPNKPLTGQNKKYSITLGKTYEFRSNSVFANVQEKITLNKFMTLFLDRKIPLVKATGISKGHGFSGSIKRWNFKGLRAGHGVGTCERAGGSTGQRTEPGRTFKNKKMAGQYGHETVSITNLEIFGFDEDLSVIYVKGSVPGPNLSYVYLSPMKQKVKRGMSNGI